MTFLYFYILMIDLSITILSYNTKDLLAVCLDAIFKSTKNLKFEVIVVDNASTDQSVELVETKYPQVTLIKNKTNLGYSAGNNLAIKKAKGEFALLLNSDTEIIGESLQIMVEFMKQHPEIGILGPKLINPDQSLQKSVGTFYSLKNVVLTMLGLERLGFGRRSPAKFSLVDWVSGACFLVRKKVFDQIGLLDEKLFMYMEEVEFCYRAKTNKILTGFLPEATILHQERGSSLAGRTDAIINIYKGLLYFYRLYKPVWQYNFLREVLKTKAGFLSRAGKIFNNADLVKTYGQALELFR